MIEFINNLCTQPLSLSSIGFAICFYHICNFIFTLMYIVTFLSWKAVSTLFLLIYLILKSLLSCDPIKVFWNGVDDWDKKNGSGSVVRTTLFSLCAQGACISLDELKKQKGAVNDRIYQ